MYLFICAKGLYNEKLECVKPLTMAFGGDIYNGRLYYNDLNAIYSVSLQDLTEPARVEIANLNNNGIHWSYNMFNYMYEHWSSVQFNILELKDLSNLFPDIEFNPSKYNMNYYQKITNDNSKVVEIIPIDKLNKLYELADKDEVYLKKILNKELNPIKII